MKTIEVSEGKGHFQNAASDSTIPSISPIEIQENISRVFSLQMQHRMQVSQTSPQERIKKLRKMMKVLWDYQSEIKKALYQDFRKSPAEVDLSEIYPLLKELRQAIKNLKKWMRPKKVGTPLTLLGTKSFVLYEPKGVVLIISPWNFPLNLTFGPLASAVAAGNCAIIKPSEMTPHISALMKKMLAEIFEENEVAVFEGDQVVAQALLDLPFHHIFFTGSPEIGKIVMKAASKHLSSVTLELGGKSPVIVDESADIQTAAKKIVWGKFFNNGQTCIAPDYILVHQDLEESLLTAMVAEVERFYGPTEEERKKSPDYNRIVNLRHCLRVKNLLEDAVSMGAQIRLGGIVDEKECYVAPTILTGVPLESTLMKQEIFGPLLPVLTFQTLREALQLINSKDKPLALYIYAQDKESVQELLQKTTCGGTCINHNVIHFFHPELPFGGVNTSGLGKGHGHHGFLAFSNERSVLDQRVKFSSVQLMFPPYSKWVEKLIQLTMKWF